MTFSFDVISANNAWFSGERSEIRVTSILLMTRMTGLLANRGLIEWKSLHYMARELNVHAHCRMQRRTCASME